ncbi:MAG: FmdE family protein [Eubacteriales bacterium]
MEITGLPDDLQGLVEQHGHICFGLLIGYRACKYAVEITGVSDNMMVVTQNENCGNDAVRFLLNCTTENGKLVCRQGNRQSWAFYNKDEEEGISLTLNPNLKSQLPGDQEQALRFLLEIPGNLLFTVEPFLCNCE